MMMDLDKRRTASFSREMPHTHASPIEIAEMARDLGVRRSSDATLSAAEPSSAGRFLRGVSDVFANVVLAYDGIRVQLDPR